MREDHEFRGLERGLAEALEEGLREEDASVTPFRGLSPDVNSNPELRSGLYSGVPSALRLDVGSTALQHGGVHSESSILLVRCLQLSAGGAPE